MSTEFPDHVELFVASQSYSNPNNPDNELSFSRGEVIVILQKNESGWWLGKTSPTTVGYFSAAFGKCYFCNQVDLPEVLPQFYSDIVDVGGNIDNETSNKKAAYGRQKSAFTKGYHPQAHMSKAESEKRPQAKKKFANLEPKARLDRFNNHMFDLANSENKYLSNLIIFNNAFIAPIQKSDSEFKRNLLEDPAIGTLLDIFNCIQKQNSSILAGLNQYKLDYNNSVEFAVSRLQPTFREYSAHLLYYAQYIATFSEAISSFDRRARKLAAYLKKNPIPEPLNLEQYLTLPQAQLGIYEEVFLALYGLDLPELRDELQCILDSMDKVQKSIDKQQTEVELLRIQGCFIGNPPIYKPGRRLIIEGELFRVNKDSTNHDKKDKQYKFHLFNDSICYSRILAANSYKFTRALNLSTSVLNNLPDLPNDDYAFEIVSGGRAFKIRAHNEATKQAWMSAINEQIEGLMRNRSSSVVGSGAGGNDKVEKNQSDEALFIARVLQGAKVASLKPRSKIIYDFAVMQVEYRQDLRDLKALFVDPLKVMSKGVSSASSQSDLFYDTKKQIGVLKQGVQLLGGALEVRKLQAQSKALNSNQISNFLEAISLFGATNNELLKLILEKCDSSEWHESMSLSQILTKMDAGGVDASLLMYASSFAMAKNIIINSTVFSSFVSNLTAEFAPRSLEDVLEQPFRDAKRRLDFLRTLKQSTPDSHPDTTKINLSIKHCTDVVDRFQAELEKQSNFQKCLEIQQSLVQTGLTQNPILETLANSERSFVKEGDLLKASRRKNIPYRFWLFNDCLLYGSKYSGTAKFEFHRCLTLDSCQVRKGSDETSFEIISKTKSFVCLCTYGFEREEWYNALSSSIRSSRSAAGLPEMGAIPAAPIWKSDGANKNCAICNKAFTTFRNRKHHCRKCGDVVWGIVRGIKRYWQSSMGCSQ